MNHGCISEQACIVSLVNGRPIGDVSIFSISAAQSSPVNMSSSPAILGAAG